MRRAELHPEADAEFVTAAQFYEAQAENLGLDFVSAVQFAVQRIIWRTGRWPGWDARIDQ